MPLRSYDWFLWSGQAGSKARVFLDHVQQADRGVDFDILVGGSGAGVVATSDAEADER